jgi:C1A family cysteine protease
LVILVSCLAIASSLKCEVKKDVQDLIYEQYASNTKSLFKVWHYLNNKAYDYNTLEGLNRYKNFKVNLKAINEHNASGSSYTMRLNHLSDLTVEEFYAFYNLKTITPEQMKAKFRQLRAVSLDDFNEDEEEIKKPVVADTFTPIDHTAAMRPVRNQGNCGSCWAFSVNAVLEGCYTKFKGFPLNDWFSTQQLVDCDTSNGGCNGGWFTGAMTYFQNNFIAYEADYLYKQARLATGCNKLAKKTAIKITGFNYFYQGQGQTASMSSMLAKGPVSIAVDANAKWMSYAGGIYDGACSSAVNHAVTLVGYGKTDAGECNAAAEYFIVRNSWGATWGEKGHIRVKKNDLNSFSCNVEKYAFQPKAFN